MYRGSENSDSSFFDNSKHVMCVELFLSLCRLRLRGVRKWRREEGRKVEKREEEEERQ